MEILMPRNLDLKSSLEFCSNINIKEDTDKIVYNYEKMIGSLEPMGMLIAGSKIREIYETYINIGQEDSNFRDKTYAANMGFFNSVNRSFGKSCYEERWGNNFIRIKSENIIDSYRLALEKGYGSDIISYIENEIAEKISTVLSRNMEELKELLKLCIVEVVRNIYDHSGSRQLWYSGQCWPSKDLVEIAILDEGKGIFETLKNNKRISVNNIEETLVLSTLPGISKRGQTLSGREIEGNSGFGLYMIKSICSEFGNFTIISSGKGLSVESNENELFDANIRGTAIRIRLNPSKMKNINVQSLKKLLSNKGTEYAEKLSKLDVISIKDIKEIGVI